MVEPSMDQTIPTPAEIGISCVEIEKRRAIKSKAYPRPKAIKQSLGNCLGNVVIALIPESITRKNEEIESIDKQRRLEASGSKNQRTAIVENDSSLMNIQRIMRIGIDQRTNLFADWEDKLIRELVNYVDECTVEMKRELNEELSKCSRAEEHKYQIEMDKVVDKYNNEFTEAKKLVETPIKNQFEKELRQQTIRLARNQAKMIKIEINKKEKELKNEFCYHVALVRSERFEEFQNEQFENKLRWGKALDDQKETNCKNLKHLRVSMEAEHIQNQTEVEHYYEMKDRRNSVAIDNLQLELNRKDVDEITILDSKLADIDIEFLKKGKELLLYKYKLEFVLNGYVDFIENCFQKQSSILSKEQLSHAKSLLEKINKMKIENHKEREHRPYVKKMIYIEQKTSHEL